MSVNENNSTTHRKPAEKPARPRHDRQSDKKSIISSIAILLLAPVLAILLTFFVFQSYQVDGPSMEPTLHNNDRLIVWKFSRTLARISGNHYIPNRGDVIIFDEPGLGNYGSSASSKQLVKRVLALPGERVVVKNGIVKVYNDEHPDGFIPDQTLPYGKETTMPRSEGDTDVRLTDSQIFVCGDNRPNSLDSRMFGPVESDQIVGKLALRILPADKFKLF